MEEVTSLSSLQALSCLLNPPNEEDEDEDCSSVVSTAKMGPGEIGHPKRSESNPASHVKSNSKAIWSEEEVAEGAQFDDIIDPRPQPEYDIVLKQTVGTEDLFLGMSRKNPSSVCCESMLLKIKLPATKVTEVLLDVKEKFLDLRTPKYKLGLHLPHPVHSQEGKARFIEETEVLEVTLPMNRLLDCVNLA